MRSPPRPARGGPQGVLCHVRATAARPEPRSWPEGAGSAPRRRVAWDAAWEEEAETRKHTASRAHS
eukprot:8606913-Alexandrium_andersonii.AAC.1